ncbi:MAG: DNA starvation/stationary phase protection protein [Planctomycetes bacterium]|nr:DNA starvation/stationary phase protection protein [Planctomycetota bacterium]
MSKDKQKVVKALERLLADSYTLYLKTHSYHWNVTGPMFTTLHTLFETHYTELALAVDEIAERIRTLGAPAPGSYSQFTAISTVKEDPTVPTATAMIENLVADAERVVASAKQVIDAAQAVGDDASVDLGVRRTEVHQKNAWMLRSHLE